MSYEYNDSYDLEELIDTLNNKISKIADLEAKLAKNKKWLASNEGFLENQKLKQQLAEKEKEIEIVKNMKADEMALKVIQKSNQDKISFALEQLRKTKFDALMLGGVVQGETFFINSEHYRNYIDNQIEELKKGDEVV